MKSSTGWPNEGDPGASVGFSGSVVISSDPAGAEIYVDGKFVGQTPSTIELPAGSHHVQVKGRDLNVLKDSQLTLHPVLESSAP